MKIVPSEWIRGVRALTLCGVAAMLLLSCAHAVEPGERSSRNTPTHDLSSSDDVEWECADRLTDVGNVAPDGTVDLAVGERASLPDGATIALECDRVENTCPPGKQCFVGPITHLKIVLTTADGQRAEGDFTYHSATKQHRLAGHTVSLLRSVGEPGQPKRHRIRLDT